MSFSQSLNLAINDPIGALTEFNQLHLEASNLPASQVQCNPWTDWSCPFLFYLIVFTISLIIAIWILITRLEKDKNGRFITEAEQLGIAAVVLGFHFVAGSIIGVLIYRLCQNCRVQQAWALFWLSLLAPIILLIIGLIILEVVFEIEIFTNNTRPSHQGQIINTG